MVRLPNWLMYVLVLVITGAWVVNFTTGLFVKGYAPPESINLVFSSMVGALLLQAGQRRHDEDDDDH